MCWFISFITTLMLIASIFIVEGNVIDDIQHLRAVEGDSVKLPCQTTVPAPVFWKYQIDSTYLTSYISGHGQVYAHHRPRMELNNITNALTIHNVTVNDTGLYSCVDNEGFGQTHYTQLTVEVKNLTEATATEDSDDTSMPTSHVILIVVLVSLVTIVAVIGSFIVVKRFKGTNNRPNEVNEPHEIIPLIASTDQPTLLSIKRVIEELPEIVEPDYELLDHLISLQVLTDGQCSKIRSMATVQERTCALLDIIVTKTETQCREFLVALTRSDQQHVVNYIQYPQDTAEHHGHDSPLDESRLLHLNVNLPQLTELIDCNVELLTTLVAKRSITRQQKDELESFSDKTKRNKKLMEILKRRSVAQLHRFVECLAANKQGHLAPVVLEKGVIVNVDAILDESSVDDVSEAENQIVSRFTIRGSECDDNKNPQVMSLLEDLFKEFLQRCDVDADVRGELRSMFEEFQEKTRSLIRDVDLVSLKKQNSIGAYFFCRTYESLQSLQKLYDNKELCQMLELMFTILHHGAGRVRIKTHPWIPNDYGQCVNYLQTPGSSTTVEDNVNKLQFPMEVLEMLLVKSFVVIFIRHLRTDGLIVSEAERLAYSKLSSVCSDWWQTLNGWPQSNTKHWVRHRLQHIVKYVCRPYSRRPQLVRQFDRKGAVFGVTQMDDKIFVVCWSDTIRVFGLNNEQLEDIKVKGLEQPRDIVACSETRSLYVADWSADCVWRVSMDGRFDKFLPTTTSSSFSPYSLSVTSGRLLVTTHDDVLLLFGADGVELKRLSFTDMSELRHAVETSRGTFVFCHLKPQRQVVEVDGDGRIISVYNDQQQLTEPCHLSIDSEGKMFIADLDKHRILLLTSDLQLDRVLLDTQHNQLVKAPWRLFYVQQTRHLLVNNQVFAVG